MGEKFLTLTSDSLLSAITMTSGESVNISLQNASNPASAVEIDVSIQDITIEDAFFNVIRLDVENAASVKITLKDAAGVNVSTLQNELLLSQETLFDSFMGAEGYSLTIEIIPESATEPIVLKKLDIDACFEPEEVVSTTPMVETACALKIGRKNLTTDECVSVGEVEYTYCSGYCAPSISEPALSLDLTTLIIDSDCTCCTGELGPAKPVTMDCAGEVKTGYIPTFIGCSCHTCIGGTE